MSFARPTICGLAVHLCRASLKRAGSIRLRIALLLLVLNFPFGYGGLALFSVIAGKTGDARWLFGGGLCYGLSWAMLLAGSALAGSSAGDFSRVAKGGWRAWRRARATAACLALAFCLCGCCGVQMPQRPLAYMYPSLMPMSALKAFHAQPAKPAHVKALLKAAGMEETLVAHGFLESDYDVLARGLAARGYAEIDARHCRKCPLRWLYIAFGEGDAQVVMRMSTPEAALAVKKGRNIIEGPGGELIFKLP